MNLDTVCRDCTHRIPHDDDALRKCDTFQELIVEERQVRPNLRRIYVHMRYMQGLTKQQTWETLHAALGESPAK